MYLKSGFENTKAKFECENSKSEFEHRSIIIKILRIQQISRINKQSEFKNIKIKTQQICKISKLINKLAFF